MGCRIGSSRLVCDVLGTASLLQVYWWWWYNTAIDSVFGDLSRRHSRACHSSRENLQPSLLIVSFPGPRPGRHWHAVHAAAKQPCPAPRRPRTRLAPQLGACTNLACRQSLSCPGWRFQTQVEHEQMAAVKASRPRPETAFLTRYGWRARYRAEPGRLRES